jgi:outer membrane protein TolC
MFEIRRRASRSAAALLTGLAFFAAARMHAQSQPSSTGIPLQQTTPAQTNLQGVQQVQQQLQTPGPAVAPQNGADQSFHGSLVSGKATAEVLPLSLDEAIQRGLKQNLGLILQSSNEKSANGQRLQELQRLLPTVTGEASIEVEQVNLAAYGLKFPGLNPIVGPFQVVDFRAYLTQNLVNLQALESYMASRHNFEAAKLTAQDARDLVVLTVGNAYLLCLADEARIAAVQAEMATSKVQLDQATQAHEAGTSPRLDVLRSQVDYQNEQQQLIATQNQFAKDKLSLARAIGLPLDQRFELSDKEPFAALDTPDPDQAFQQALKQRKDLAAASEQLKGAEANRKSAFDEQLPVASFAGDFGDLGTTPGHSHSTYSATGQVSAPILQIAKTHGDEQVAEAQAEQAKAKLSDQVQQVNQDVRDAILDIESAAKLVDASRSNVQLASEALNEAQQRFKVGVSDSLPVSQALAQDEQANDQYISAVYQHNVAKLSLARALGVASTNYKDYLGGK